MVKFGNIAAKFLLSVLVTSLVVSASRSEYWKLMDFGYDISYLEPVEELVRDGVLACASESLLRNVTAFGYEDEDHLCILLNVDYYEFHFWTPVSGMDIYLRNEDIDTSPCFDSSCGFCMYVLETPVSWDDADIACGGELILTAPGWMHRCIVMQLQYLRKPTTNVYWLYGTYDHTGYDTPEYYTESTLWSHGQPDNSKECILLDAGDQYRLSTADCSETHYALCYSLVQSAGSR
ncbi:uncharacterized protein [Haliotis asinina]|uniref:uncharacterized protein n=1 Tax=Haliotis asinina TaxID=109174 RepID=UPI00353228D6